MRNPRRNSITRMKVRATIIRKPGIPVRSLSTAVAITCVWLCFILLWEWTGGDLSISYYLADSRGFTLQNNWWLRVVLHDGMRWVSTLVYAGLVIAIWKPCGLLRSTTQRQRVEMLVGVTAALLIINWIKNSSLTSCPWDLTQFGGTAHYVSHWAWGLADGGPGRCFPSGHASAGYAFFPVALPFLFASSAAVQQRGMRIFYAVLLFGLICGLAQVLRGAHYPSHVLWTGLICWVVAVVNHRLFRYSGKAVASDADAPER